MLLKDNTWLLKENAMNTEEKSFKKRTHFK
ncbi:unnamed protein product [Larinioides sclopetarius]|uniref:Uncharacterized protein n=1 Tax=Larinioides sclopetarius TaxID=280406 RepID=A0AAV2BTZ5_9ARAC